MEYSGTEGLSLLFGHARRVHGWRSTLLIITVIAGLDGKAVLQAQIAGRVARATTRIERPLDFQRDIGAIFTQRGCNSSGCHGSVKGRGGFKLSQNALSPKEDYKWILEGGMYQVLTPEAAAPVVPRVNLREPEKSLLSLKPTMAVPHGGGQRFSPDSEDYQILLSWIRKGAPYGEEGAKDGRQVATVEVFPRETVLALHSTQQLRVTAQLSSGEKEDVTERVRYVPMSEDVLEVTDEGLIKPKKAGETAVIIYPAGYEPLSVRIGVIARPIPNYPVLPRRNFIDDYVFDKLQKLNIVPSELSSDSEFLRRICLDLTGTLPPTERAREFLASQDPQKREKLVDILLETPEYIDYWTFRFSDLFRVGLYPAGGGPKGSYSYSAWLRNGIARNRPYDQIAQERLAAQGFDGPSRHYMNGKVRPIEELVSEEVRVFLGRRLDCAQCHNHPFETWSQNQFWGLAAFFGGMKPTEWPTQYQVLYDDSEGQEIDYGVMGKVLGETSQVMHPRTKQAVEPTFLDGTVLPKDKSADPRMQLAKWMTSHPYFAEAIVNRMWGYFFGRGIVHPVDDFRSTNPPTHPELLAGLARDFREHGHDLKQLIRLIVSSRVYQLSSVPNETNEKDTINYSHAFSRPLDAEVLLDAITAVTGVPEAFERSSGTGGREPLGTKAIQLKESDTYPSRFMDIHGRPDRMMVPERDGKPNLLQAFHTLAGTTYTDKLSREGGHIDQLLKSGASDRRIIEELSLAALSRYATEDEQKELGEMIRQAPSRRRALEDLLWGLVNSREFAYRH